MKIGLIFVLLLLGALAVSVSAKTTVTTATTTANTAASNAPLDFELADEASFVKLSALPAQLTLINFWRSDCPPCVREMPVLADVARNSAARVFTIAVQRPSETLGAHEMVRHALNSPIRALHAPSESRGLMARFGNKIGALPHTVMLNASRQMCAMKAGEIDRVWLNEAFAACAGAAQIAQ